MRIAIIRTSATTNLFEQEMIKMKKGTLTVVAVVLAMALATGAFAFGPGYGGGAGNCPAQAQLTPEQSQKFTQFQNEILPMKQKMIQLRTELMTLRSQTPTDWNAVSAKQKEMVDLRIAIQQKAESYGFKGRGFGMGRGMGGNGPGGRF
jgi:Spy/CpxP family protein refolding chaperone